jgi:sec-independent protein translocase protein TatC
MGDEGRDGKRMSVGEHLIELRSRIIVCLIATALGMLVGYVFCPDVFFPIVRAPLDAMEGNEAANPFVVHTPLLDRLGQHVPDASQRKLHMLSLQEGFIIQLKLALVVGIILALPVIVYEIWAFVAAGLYAHERQWVLLYGPASFLLFLSGVAVAYFVVLPLAVVVLLNQGRALGLDAALRVSEYVPFVMWLLLGFGIVFQMPLVVVFLTRLGIVTPRALSRSRRYALMAIVVLSAVLTPQDPFTLLAMAVPLALLYEVSILLSWLVRRRRSEG